MQEPILAEQIAKELRRDILRGNLAPGDSLKERDKAAEMGVSRTPMREAIRILAQEGLVQLRPARSPIVARPDVKEVTDDVEVLLAIEKLSGELACRRATDDDIAGIAEIVQQMVDNFDTLDALELFEIDMSFHLSAVQRRNRASVIEHHTAILRALQARDSEAIRLAIGTHLDRLTDDIGNVIRREQEEAGSDKAPTSAISAKATLVDK